VSYWSNGQLYSKGEYNNGKQHGEWISYFGNGQLEYKGSFINDKEIGMWKEWNINTKEYDNIFYG